MGKKISQSTAKNHLALKVGQIPKTVLLSGDPKRIEEMVALWETHKVVGDNREFLTVVGRYQGHPVAACSTGIGGPSTEIAVIELYQRGARSLVRVGTSGGLASEVKPGDLLITTACIRETGAADAFVSRSYPAAASFELTLALIEACSRAGRGCHVGLGVTVDSFYATKPHLVKSCRAGKRDFPSTLHSQLEIWIDAGALHMEMETATIFVLASLLGIRAGSICTAGSNLPRGERPQEPPSNLPAIETACRAVSILDEWDALSQSSPWGFHPGLLLSKQQRGR